MTSEGISALLPANVDRRRPLLLPLHVFLLVLYNKSLNDWSLEKQFILFSPKFNVFPGFASGEQNELFPSGPVINLSVYCLPSKTLHKHCFQFLLGHTMVPRENKNNPCAKFWRANKQINKWYGKWPILASAPLN